MKNDMQAVGSNIEIEIATYNRPQILENWLKENYVPMRDLGISLAIYDSSTNDETEKLIEMFNNSTAFGKIRYVKKDSAIRIDEKIMQSIMECPVEYSWPLGDSRSIDFEDIKRKVLPFIENNYDFVCTFGSSYLDNDGKTYTSSLEFFSDCFWHATWLGGLIYNRRIFQPLLNQSRYKEMLAKYNRNDGFSNMGIFYELISDRPIKAGFSIIKYDEMIGKKKVQAWLKRFMEVWCDNLIYFVDTIPNYYNPAKEKVLKETWRVLDLDGVWSYKARKSGALNKEIYDYYDAKGYIDRVLDNKKRIRRFATLNHSLLRPYLYMIKLEKICNRLLKKFS